MKLRSKSLALLLSTAALFIQPQNVYAHQPVDLGIKNITADQGPILSDATVSFAIRANFTKANQTRSFRAVFKASELWLNLMSEVISLSATLGPITSTLADFLKPSRLASIK